MSCCKMGEQSVRQYGRVGWLILVLFDFYLFIYIFNYLLILFLILFFMCESSPIIIRKFEKKKTD